MFRSRDNREAGPVDEENPFLLSFSDLMAGLVAIFILALIVMMIQLHIKQQELDEETRKIRITLIQLLGSLKEIQEAQDAIDSALDGVGLRERSLTALLEGVREDLEEKGIEVVVAENGSVLRIPEAALNFQLGSFQIEKEFYPAANAIGEALLVALEQEENLELLDTVFIEGHTDAVPNKREMGNWGLSAYRAISLWKFWTDSPGECSELKDLKTLDRPYDPGGKPLISVSGYAETRPTGLALPQLETGNSSERGNASDRRIDIRFTLATAEKQDLEGLKQKVSKMKEKTQDLIDRLEQPEP